MFQPPKALGILPSLLGLGRARRWLPGGTAIADRRRPAKYTPDGTTAYVTNRQDNTVSVINTATNTVTGTVTGFSEADAVAINSHEQNG